MSGPEQYMDVAWTPLHTYVDMDEPAAAGLYVGRKHREHTSDIGYDITGRVLYDMPGCVMSSSELYQEVFITATGKEATLTKVASPFVDADHAVAVARTPVANGPCIECEWCGHTFPDSDDCKRETGGAAKQNQVAARKGANTNHASNNGSGGESAADGDDEDTATKGTMPKAVSSVLMKILYVARMARPDALRPTSRLASYVTKWSPCRHIQLHRLVCYNSITLDNIQDGCNSQRDVNNLQVEAYSDAAIAGCVETRHSTTGGPVCLDCPASHAPIPSLSKRPDSTASTIPEGEIIATNTVVRTMLMPSLDIWVTWLHCWDKGHSGHCAGRQRSSLQGHTSGP